VGWPFIQPQQFVGDESYQPKCPQTGDDILTDSEATDSEATESQPVDQGLDLTPEPVPAPATGRASRWSARNTIIVSVLVAVLAFLVFQALSNARVFFYNVDEAIELRDELGETSFRMQGNVVSEDGVDEVGALLFTVGFGGETANIRHTGDEPSDLFELGQSVVVEGHWDGDAFVSSQILVKHSEEYVEDNPDRFDPDSDDNE